MIKEYGGKETYKNAKQKAMHEKKETKKTEVKEKGKMDNKNMRSPMKQTGKVAGVVVKTKSAPSKKPVTKSVTVVKATPIAMKKKKC